MVENNTKFTLLEMYKRRRAFVERFVCVSKRKVILYNPAVQCCRNVFRGLRQKMVFKCYSTSSLIRVHFGYILLFYANSLNFFSKYIVYLGIVLSFRIAHPNM